MIRIIDEDKARLAAFIDFHFEKVKKENGEYTLDQFIEGICSIDAYKEMIAGIHVQDPIYAMFLKKIDFLYNDDDESIHTIQADELEVVRLLEQYEMKKFCAAIQVLLEMLEPYRNYALESVIYDCLQIVLSVNINAYECRFLLERFPMLDPYAKEICGYFILDYMYRYAADEVDEQWLSAHGLRHLTSLATRFCILKWLIRFEAYYDASVYCENLLKECVQKKNMQLAYYVKIKRLYIVMKIQPNDFESYANQVSMDDVAKKGQEDAYTFEFYHVVGMHYYLAKKYEQAWLYFIRAIHAPAYYFPEVIFLNHIATLQQKELPETIRMDKEIDEEHQMYESLYMYYGMKNRKETPQMLEDYLWDRCIRQLRQFYPTWIMKQVVLDEMIWISKKTGNKKRLQILKDMEC